jgi:hypothetical protein
LNQIVDRVEDLKTRQVTNSGAIIADDGKTQQNHVLHKRKVFSQKVFVERDSLLTVK